MKKIRMNVAKIESLVNAFNVSRANNFSVENLVKDIAKVTIDDLYFDKDYEARFKISAKCNLNDTLREELEEYISKELLKLNTITTLYDSDGTFCGLGDEFGEFVVKGLFFHGLGPNEFLRDWRPMEGVSHRVLSNLKGIKVRNNIAFKDKLYVLSDSKLCENSVSDHLYSSYDDVLSSEEDYYICKVYNQDGLNSINYVYPNRNAQEDKFKENAFVGNIVKYTREKKELLSYYSRFNGDDSSKILSSQYISNKEWDKIIKDTGFYPADENIIDNSFLRKLKRRLK